MITNEGLHSTYHLSKMNTILNYQLSGAGIGLTYLLMFAASGLIVAVLDLAAIVFSGYLLFVLKKENHKAWFYSFIFCVLIPNSIMYILGFVYSNYVLLIIPLVPFYFFFFLIRVSANEWLSEKRAKNQMIIEKIEREEKLKAYMTNFEG
ncbi:MAG: hypothetical protein GXX85_16640 [Ignavibacteria bacterium]|nr:hypothetical protein [Ignavibacteria bacterium]